MLTSTGFNRAHSLGVVRWFVCTFCWNIFNFLLLSHSENAIKCTKYRIRSIGQLEPDNSYTLPTDSPAPADTNATSRKLHDRRSPLRSNYTAQTFMHGLDLSGIFTEKPVAWYSFKYINTHMRTRTRTGQRVTWSNTADSICWDYSRLK